MPWQPCVAWAAAVARFRGALTDANNSYRRADARASDPRKHSTYAEVGSAADAAQLHEIRPNVVACDRHRNIDTQTVAAMLRTRLRLAPHRPLRGPYDPDATTGAAPPVAALPRRP